MKAEYQKTISRRVPVKQLLGNMPDSRLASLLGVERERIRQLRGERGIPKFTFAEKRDLSDVKDRAFEELSITDIALVLGTTWDIVDAERKRRGIPSRRDRWAEIWKKIDPLLGIVPDDRIAKKHKIAPGTVRSRRTRKGIPACGRGWDRKKEAVEDDES